MDSYKVLAGWRTHIALFDRIVKLTLNKTAGQREVGADVRSNTTDEASRRKTIRIRREMERFPDQF
ncbi:hypothetical protein HDG34_007539 [Paraburkholderia sp. HC6.4b]|uniref:hypothetical protein n=1 Tax=unclassified Paraburkholderia TaxID=2615204 RepID=UPI001610CBDC|nr:MULTISPECIES: hypothetical protein [unclassified Paraburkholderia]MBB5413561.1 hypothetical protein [Paraburkholderia sp. HC6.4b]MBB5455946.1 hypothetical protein [Paraburkholderia sp. Kb1A]